MGRIGLLNLIEERPVEVGVFYVMTAHIYIHIYTLRPSTQAVRKNPLGGLINVPVAAPTILNGFGPSSDCDKRPNRRCLNEV